jgi:hypothetical protein
MDAQLTTFVADLARLDELLDYLRQNFAPVEEHEPGSRGVEAMVDRDRSTVLLESRWDCAESMQRSRRSITSTEHFAGFFAASMSIEQYHVVKSEHVRALGLEATARVVRFAADEDSLGAFEESALRRLLDRPGGSTQDQLILLDTRP